MLQTDKLTVNGWYNEKSLDLACYTEVLDVECTAHWFGTGANEELKLPEIMA